ncbi:hypothetical protein E2542_SST31462 [Spatholobus suberectus]|nr:hypothetical protein E2542_SST31462 [Spatholobus suberectus]
MVEYLQSFVGIMQKNHVESITTSVKKSVDEKLEDNFSMQTQQKKCLTFYVEDNINDLGPDHFNILGAIYAKSQRSFLFVLFWLLKPDTILVLLLGEVKLTNACCKAKLGRPDAEDIEVLFGNEE